MRAVCQRVKNAELYESGKLISSIGQGLLVYAGFSVDDSPESIKRALDKIAGLRIFDDSDGKLNLSLSAIDGGMMFVSNFTLYGDCSRGYRPSFVRSAGFEAASKLYDGAVEYLRSKGVKVVTGVFGGDMTINSSADGPVNIIVDGEDL